MRRALLRADARAIPLPDNSVAAIVCDPPYGLEFMGKEWDKLARNHPLDPSREIAKDSSPEPRAADNPWQKEASGYGAPRKNARCKPCKCETPDWDTRTAEYARTMQEWHETWAVEALRVLKPGGHLVAFGGTRTSHRLTCALEDVGFEIRDALVWLYGSGFPKSLDVSKAIDKAAGAEREVVGQRPIAYPDSPSGYTSRSANSTARGGGIFAGPDGAETAHGRPVTEPVTDEAKRWRGWGTALKPAHEPIVLARKPLSEKTVAANVQRWGTGALNIDASRIPGDVPSVPQPDFSSVTARATKLDANRRIDEMSNAPGGRWPANVVLDEESARLLDEQSGELHSQDPNTRKSDKARGGRIFGERTMGEVYGDTGGASRFFYCAKASSSERGEGNHHPTVKPVDLMKWLVRMVTPPGGLVLDPFLGSGTTGRAARALRFDFVGLDLDASYLKLATKRTTDVQTEFA